MHAARNRCDLMKNRCAECFYSSSDDDAIFRTTLRRATNESSHNSFQNCPLKKFPFEIHKFGAPFPSICQNCFLPAMDGCPLSGGKSCCSFNFLPWNIVFSLFRYLHVHFGERQRWFYDTVRIVDITFPSNRLFASAAEFRDWLSPSGPSLPSTCGGLPPVPNYSCKNGYHRISHMLYLFLVHQRLNEL